MSDTTRKQRKESSQDLLDGEYLNGTNRDVYKRILKARMQGLSSGPVFYICGPNDAHQHDDGATANLKTKDKMSATAIAADAQLVPSRIIQDAAMAITKLLPVLSPADKEECEDLTAAEIWRFIDGYGKDVGLRSVAKLAKRVKSIKLKK